MTLHRVAPRSGPLLLRPRDPTRPGSGSGASWQMGDTAARSRIGVRDGEQERPGSAPCGFHLAGQRAEGLERDLLGPLGGFDPGGAQQILDAGMQPLEACP